MIAKNIRLSDNKQELVKSVLPGLPISAFYTFFSKDTYSYIDWHWHEAFQYCLVTEGSVDFLLPNRSYRVTKGNGIFINLQQVHLCKGTTSETSAYFCIDIPPAFICGDEHSRIYLKYLAPIMEQPTSQALIISKHSPGPLQILNALQEIQSLLRNAPDFLELDILTKVLNIWKYTFQMLNIPTNSDFTDNNRIKIIIQYLQQHYSDKITLDDVALHLALSRSECCRFFKKVTGQTMFSYLNSLRIHKSMDLLKNTEMGIAEIADAAGFCSQSYFTDCFKKMNKITPKKYRELSERIPNNVLSLDIQ